MTIVQKYGNIQKNADQLVIWALTNKPDNSAYVPANAEPQIPIEGINTTDVGTKFFEEVRGSYKQDQKHHILTSLFHKDCKYAALDNSLDYILKSSYENGRFFFFDGILYHSS
ncbi:hypothetical protein O181_062918 [Austropuccinia psidii MF-1]|uniref:Uncharacterized protein n=1 Tax=Austropuccinia psidii MF-1 TaxID=1389203 RepID=A0A9Q3EKG5_9BASI|nr:hypothetical protein [Austropuccinia psidii MF-1]